MKSRSAGSAVGEVFTIEQSIAAEVLEMVETELQASLSTRQLQEALGWTVVWILLARLDSKMAVWYWQIALPTPMANTGESRSLI